MAKPPTYDELVALIDADRVVGRLIDLVRIPSVNPFGKALGDGEGEGRVAEYMGSRLDDLGWATGRVDVSAGRPNVWGAHGGDDGPTLNLAGHLDTVGVVGHDAPFSGSVGSGRVHGRGSCDMKAGLAAYLEVAEILAASSFDLAGRLVISGLADEEHGMIGSRAYPGHGPASDFAVIGEPTSLRVCTAHPGQFSLVITTHGRAAHSSVPEQGVNAIEQMGRVLDALAGYRAEILQRPAHRLCGTGRLSPGVISGGDMVAIVPDRCELEVDRRITPDDTRESVLDDLRRHLDPLTDADPDFRYELSEPTWDIDSLDTPIDSPVVAAVSAAAAAVGVAPDPVGFPAATDGPNLAVPSVICGPGSIDQAHTVDEYVEIDDVMDAVKLYLRVVLDLLG